MNILFTIHGYKPAYRLGGPIISVSALAEQLVKKGHRVIVFATNSNLDEDLDVPLNRPIYINGVEVWYFERNEFIKRWLSWIPYLSKTSGFNYAPKMHEELNRIMPEIDVVHTHLPFIYPTFAAAKVAKRFHKPLFYSQRGVLDRERLKFRSVKKKFYIKAIEHKIMSEAVLLFALTNAEIDSYHALNLSTPCKVIPNGIDLSNYKSDKIEAVNKLKSRCKCIGNSKIILFLGRLHPNKGVDKLLEAFFRAVVKMPDLILILAGPDEFGLERKFKKTVENRKLTEKVIFPGMITGDVKYAYLTVADLFCLPSEAEGFSISVLEALASSTPVLLSEGCHFDEVEAAGIGKIIEPTVENIEDMILKLFSDANNLAKMGEAGRYYVSKKLTWDTIADQYIEAYTEGQNRYNIKI